MVQGAGFRVPVPGSGFRVQGSGIPMTMKFALMLMMMSAALTAQAPAAKKPASESVAARAARIHKEAIVVDTHIDTTMMLGREGWDFMVRHQPTKGEDSNHVDLPRAREGGLDAAFFSNHAELA